MMRRWFLFGLSCWWLAAGPMGCGSDDTHVQDSATPPPDLLPSDTNRPDDSQRPPAEVVADGLPDLLPQVDMAPEAAGNDRIGPADGKDAAPGETALPDVPNVTPDVPLPDMPLPDGQPDLSADGADLFDGGLDLAAVDEVTPYTSDITIHPELWNLGTVIETFGNGLLARVETPYGDLLVARLQGTHREMGYQYGRLMGSSIVDLWWTFMNSILNETTEFESPDQVDALLGLALDMAWQHMQPHVPQRFLDEFEGISAGAADADVQCGCHATEGVGQLVRRMLTILEVSQTQSVNFEEGIQGALDYLNSGGSTMFHEYFNDGAKRKPSAATDPAVDGRDHGERKRGLFHTCSYFAIWGDRTQDGHMLASRVLDFTADMGINAYKLITVYQPDDGYGYVTMGYTGCPMAGMSENGIAVGMVGSASVLERSDSSSGLIKMREVLETSANLEDARGFFENNVPDGINRPNSIGANALAVWGDPAGNGAQAQAIALELNGIFTGAYYAGPAPTCDIQASLHEFDRDGWPANVWTYEDNPDRVNLESEAYEIDKDGNVRTFAVDDQGQFVIVDGHYVPDPDGQPLKTGQPLTCALYRGDEALSYGVRRWQSAANGPWRDDGSGTMMTSGSYRERYMVMHDMIAAYETGSAYSFEDDLVIPDNGGQRVPIGLDEGDRIASEAAMNSNILCVVYDATALEFDVAYESGSGDTWLPASANAYARFRLPDMLHPW